MFEELPDEAWTGPHRGLRQKVRHLFVVAVLMVGGLLPRRSGAGAGRR